MKVRATKTGYIYHKRRREGDVFELKPFKGYLKKPSGQLESLEMTAEKQFSPTWMEKVDDNYVDEPKSSSALAKRHKKKVEVDLEEISADDDVI